MNLDVSKFRQHIVGDLAVQPGASSYWLSVLCTPTRKTGDLFPHAQRSKKYKEDILQRDILVLLSQAPAGKEEEKCLISAMEINVYSLVAHDSAIVYISKVDSTGQVLPTTGSATSCLVKSVLSFFLSGGNGRLNSLRIQLFARAQNQYIFPNSSDFSGKRVLTDLQLCRWWKKVLTASLVRVQDDPKQLESRNFYIIPGHTKVEAERICNDNHAMTVTLAKSLQWDYGHPYTSETSSKFATIPHPSSSAKLDCFDYIPTFSDDPKARFLVELAATCKVPDRRGHLVPGSPAKKRIKSASVGSSGEISDDGHPDPWIMNPESLIAWIQTNSGRGWGFVKSVALGR